MEELEKLYNTFYHRWHFTNDSIVMVGDLEKLKECIENLKLKLNDYE